MKPTKTKIAMFLILLLTLATVRGYSLLVNKGVSHFNNLLYESYNELATDPDAKRTLNSNGTVSYSKTEKTNVIQASTIEKIGKQRFAFIIFTFVFFFFLIYILAIVAVSLITRLNQTQHNNSLN